MEKEKLVKTSVQVDENSPSAEDSDNDSIAKFNSIEEQAKAYEEAEKALTRKSQEVAELKKQLESNNELMKQFDTQDMSYRKDLNKHSKLDQLRKIELKKVDQFALNDVNTLAELYKQGKISAKHAKHLRDRIDERLGEEKIRINASFKTYGLELASKISNSALESFKNEKPEFFDSPEKQQAIEFLVEKFGVITPEELKAAGEFVESIEMKAVEKFSSDQAKQGALLEENKSAISKLNSATSTSGAGNSSLKKSFTRDQIKKMSNKEFAKHEKEIIRQMQEGRL